MKFWGHTLVFSLLFYFLILFYLFASEGYIDRTILNRAHADTAVFLIGLSFAFSGICYFWNFADKYFIYRKYLGLSGFAFALSHVAITILLLNDVFPFPSYYQIHENVPAFILGVYAILIYAFMAAISNKFASHLFGGPLWRSFLRLGYIAYVFTILHFALKSYPSWLTWISKGSFSLPPITLPLTIFGAGVILLRIAVWISQKRKKQSV
ncbi:MAG: hypothetical protein HY428_00880 [Candidatus Levybacteria bacterium]|nr:hypothetical protein [Candidatus Levybacteria bacterium]